MITGNYPVIVRNKSIFGKKNSQGGFTLMELMIAIAIIGILASIAIPNYISYLKRALIAHAQAELKSLEKVIAMLAADSNCYPNGDPIGDFEQGGPDFYLDDDPDNIVLIISAPFEDP